ncbi:F0F1 ATP synthase subunit B [Acidithiobacillus sp. CV18-2]|uniref:ATP synthase subunit b n=1 Tax=Igneacidithiobacillus copahuensis TaxID=2724909 RepID=A0AAE2YNP3_9PROT|nr:F0F1 ATP synthase subunit B [Igneacidithiobacillus copahuensis]MBU2754540.1 F0F1 ATP synthase subunit B [Acidithiobacillus sp. CV18-3]MBU2757298.1 F0F1 ATP synthase subunit B [Acidithiobacillus sp. BN09-2]MBU2776867.1 F0F1 ATP synthase subunit B [Acidithiobacillus sp. CV18-2]MBU2796294.1 F0F1 ATP synthase subunit B [Acidithiobacillus sp. VAN18-2]MBU2799403.1 F0F1 ATP synthase subunit B [Acidithiobacillus sp. VAN18-4]UTV81087.1 F0F1 ATP synthase subunit B [Acidithiobacillus sp. YTS05]
MNPVSINGTLIIQLITFVILVILLYKYLYGPLRRVMDDRSTKIADGLAAAERGQEELDLAQKRAAEILREAKDKASEIIALAERRDIEMREEAQIKAREEADRIIAAARAEIEVEGNRAREQLRGEVVRLVVDGSQQILHREINAENHRDIVDRMVAQL